MQERKNIKQIELWVISALIFFDHYLTSDKERTNTRRWLFPNSINGSAPTGTVHSQIDIPFSQRCSNLRSCVRLNDTMVSFSRLRRLCWRMASRNRAGNVSQSSQSQYKLRLLLSNCCWANVMVSRNEFISWWLLLLSLVLSCCSCCCRWRLSFAAAILTIWYRSFWVRRYMYVCAVPP